MYASYIYMYTILYIIYVWIINVLGIYKYIYIYIDVVFILVPCSGWRCPIMMLDNVRIGIDRSLQDPRSKHPLACRMLQECHMHRFEEWNHRSESVDSIVFRKGAMSWWSSGFAVACMGSKKGRLRWSWWSFNSSIPRTNFQCRQCRAV